jgi:hypothetical protein
VKDADQVAQLGSFLDSVLSDPILAGIFLLHRDELFQRLWNTESGITVALGTTGLPFMTHPVAKLRSSLNHHFSKVAENTPRRQRQEGEDLIENLQDATGDRPLDAIVTACGQSIKPLGSKT